tara:strand:- start:202 stop:1155 length:954 start_codon:yes stop_codon:yes gene_type:complete
MKNTRRKFIKNLAASSIVIPFSNELIFAEKISNKNKYPINFFSKPIDKFGMDFIIDTLKMAGLDGVDLTVRPKGSVLPEKVEEDLPKFAELAKKRDLLLEMMVTNITSAESPYARKLLSVAANHGINNYRMGYYKYNDNESAKQTIKRAESGILSLIELNKKVGIQGGYQNHTGNYFGSPIWDLLTVLKGTKGKWINSQFDIYHAYAEGYRSWPISMEMIANKIGSFAIKDFNWKKLNQKARLIKVPLGQGVVDLDGFFNTIKKLKIVAPISLHIEYPLLNQSEEQLPILAKQKIIVNKIKNEVRFIRLKLSQHQII